MSHGVGQLAREDVAQPEEPFAEFVVCTREVEDGQTQGGDGRGRGESVEVFEDIFLDVESR